MIKTNGKFIIANRKSFIRSMHALQINLLQLDRQEAQYVLAERSVKTGIGNNDDKVWRYNRRRRETLDRSLDRVECVGIGARQCRWLGSESVPKTNIYTSIVNNIANMIYDVGYAVTRQDTEIYNRTRLARQYVFFSPRLEDRYRGRGSNHGIRCGILL